MRSAVLEMARLGGAGVLFHYPGYGDSYGDLAPLELADLSRAATDAITEASRRCPGLSWFLAGFMFGAAVACLAQREIGGELMLLVQPELRPATYFERLANRSEPLAPGPSPREMMEAGSTPGMAYGYPLPVRILEVGAEADAAVAAALAQCAAEGAVIGHPPLDAPERLPAHFEQIEVPGKWRFGAQNHPRLARAAATWLEANTQGGL
jgi:hypothetical protein